MSEWIKISDKSPQGFERIWTYNEQTGSIYLCEFGKVLTWGGYKWRFINLLSRHGFTVEVTHWAPINIPPMPLKEDRNDTKSKN